MAGARIEQQVKIVKTDATHGLVFGYAIVCDDADGPYYDLQGHHIPEDAMLGAAIGFMKGLRTAKAMHEGESAGQVLFAFPMTADVATALEMEVAKTGLIIAMQPEPAMLEKFMSGEFTGFSIGGFAQELEEVDDDE